MASLGMSGGQASEEALALTLRGQREAMQRGLLLQPSGPGCYLPVAAIGFGSRGQASAPALPKTRAASASRAPGGAPICLCPQLSPFSVGE